MENIRVGVVILNYKVYQETLECVQTFQYQTYKNIEIIIIENGSKNESAEVLCETYKGIDNVHVIINDINLGFAKGNNLGIRYARENLNCNNVIIINSDTIVEPTIVDELVTAIEPGVGIISPCVINMDGNFQIPSVNTANMPKEIFKTIYKIFLTNFLESFIFKKVYKEYKKRQSNIKRNYKQFPKAKNYYLQGCSFMLTNEFFKHYTQLYPKTFLYWEELNLLWYMYKADLKTKFVNTSPVVHKVAVSTKYLIEDKEYKKRRNKLVMDGLKKSLPLYFTSYKRICHKYN